MNDLVEQALLFDFYGELLTERQRNIYEAVVFDDFSLSEVAEDQGITRQGVHDMIRRCQKALNDYEAKLGLVRKFEQTKALANSIQVQTKAFRRDQDMEHIDRIEGILKEIEAL